MMASSPRAVLTGQKKITTRVYVTIITIILLSLSISVESSIFSVRERLTARVGDTINIPFEYCGLPKPSCTLTQNFNLSAPNPTCTADRYGHCEVTPAPDDDPIRDYFNIGCELCVLVIHGVTQKDAGRYAICESSGACTSSFWSTISTLEVVSGNEEPPTPTKPTPVIFGVRERLTARVGDTGNIPFELCGLPRLSCTLAHSFKLSAPNPKCTVDRLRYCEVARAPDIDKFREGMDSVCELCLLVVHEVTKRDAGPYAICQTSGSGSCTSPWHKISTLKVVSGNEEPPTSMSTKPTTEENETASSSTMTVKPSAVLSTKYTDRVGNDDAQFNEKRKHPSGDITLIVVGVSIAVLATAVATVVVIWKNRRARKRRRRSKSHDQLVLHSQS